MKPGKKAVVIGAGIGGLSAAARLAAGGCAVTVVERSDTYGGKMGILRKDGFTWDTGPSLFTQPYLLEDLAAACRMQLSDYLQYIPVPEGTRYFWEDGTALSTPVDKEDFGREIADALHISPGPTMRYLRDAAALYNTTASIFLNRPLNRLSTWASGQILPALRTIRPAYLLRSLHAYNAAALQHPKLVQIFDRMATYNGSDPYRCPAMLSAIAHLEFNEGIFYPAGGMTSTAQAVYRMGLEAGVKFVFGNEARRIIHNNGRVTGVETAQGLLPAEAVLSNSDVYNTYLDMLGERAAAAKLERQERSTSGLVFYWGMNRVFGNLGLHNIFFPQDYAAEFGALRDGKVSDDLTVYLNITSKMEAGFAPEGGEAWFILVNVPPLQKGVHSYDDALVARVRAAVIRRLSSVMGEDVSRSIASETVLTPAGIEAGTGSHRGALYGSASNSPMAAFLRHPVRSRRYKGLFFCGGTVHPGGGIPLCLRSGKMAAEEILKKQG